MNLIYGIGAIIIVYIIMKIFSLPIRLFFKLLINTAAGFIALVVIDVFSGFTGVYLGLNLINSLVVGIFGLPGLGFLFIARWLLLI